jgi:alpha-L-fucosidase
VTALRAAPRPLRVGLYHSLVEWFNPLYLADKEGNSTDYPDQVLVPMLRDIVERYQPSMIWADGTKWQAGVGAVARPAI